MNNSDWISRPEFNWCFGCWFSAKIESKETPIGTIYLCRNCGLSVHRHKDDKETNIELPRYFTDNEWDEYWNKNIKIKE